jgi:hypothetical protein
MFGRERLAFDCLGSNREERLMTDGIIPPYTSYEWQNMRRFLRKASEYCTAAADASTTEEVSKNMIRAKSALADADFVRLQISNEEKNR